MVVSPFVTKETTGPDSATAIVVDTVKSLSNVTFLQNQVITRGTHAAGAALVAYGSQPRTTGYRSSLSESTKVDRKTQTGKGFKPYTDKSGRKFVKGLNKFAIGPVSDEYGYRTSLKKNRKGPLPRSRGAMNLGKALPVLGLGLVGLNIYNSYVAGDSKSLTFEKALGLPNAVMYDKTFVQAHGKTIRQGYLVGKVLWSLS